MPEIVQVRRYDFAKFKCCLHVRLIGSRRQSWNNGLIIDLDHSELIYWPITDLFIWQLVSWPKAHFMIMSRAIKLMCSKTSMVVSWALQLFSHLSWQRRPRSISLPSSNGLYLPAFPNPALIISGTKPWPYRNQRPGVNNPCVYFGHEEGKHALNEWERAWCTLHIW